MPRKTSKAPPPQREHFNLLPIVKAYPVVDPKYGEAVCVAALTTDVPRRWIRLFPLDFRNMDFSQQFRKYQHISVDAFRAKGDHRPESYTPVLDTIKLGTSIGTDRGRWARRVELCEPLILPSMCELQRRQAADGTSLGMFRPGKVRDVVVEPAKGITGKQQAALDQGSLLRYPEVPIVFAGSRQFAEEWTYRFFGAAAGESGMPAPGIDPPPPDAG